VKNRSLRKSIHFDRMFELDAKNRKAILQAIEKRISLIDDKACYAANIDFASISAGCGIFMEF
jgi:hypothetical protein